MIERSKKQKTKGLSRLFGIGVCLLTIIVGVVCFVVIKKENKEENEIIKTYDDLRIESVQIIVNEDGSEELKIDWDELAEYDVVGWIKLGEYINYPIVQNKEKNQYYLTRTYERNYNSNGSIFMQYNNNQDFMDYNTIIYGHNMHNGSTVMFGSLMEYTKQSKDNPSSFD